MARVPRLTLDGAQVELPEGEPVGAVLPPTAIAARVDGVLRDLSHVPDADQPADSAVEPFEPASNDGLHRRVVRWHEREVAEPAVHAGRHRVG